MAKGSRTKSSSKVISRAMRSKTPAERKRDGKSGVRSIHDVRFPNEDRKYLTPRFEVWSLAPSLGHVTGMEEAFAHLKQHRVDAEARRRRDEGRRSIGEILSQAYALVGDTFDPAHTVEVNALLDRLNELGAVVYDRRDVERWRVERAEAEVAAEQRRR